MDKNEGASTIPISTTTLKKVLTALGDHHFHDIGDGEEDNNDDVIEAEKLLRLETDGKL